MDLLKRELAPILPEAWKLIDDEARRVLRLNLAGRKVVEFEGPHGWRCAAVNTGRLELLKEEPVEDVSVGIRRVQPLIEVRTPIVLKTMDLDTVARGGEDPDLAPVVRAAEKIARLEDRAIFHGYPAGGISGIAESSPHPAVPVAKVEEWPRAVVLAKEVLRTAGIAGPYALLLGRRAYDEVSAAASDGYPIRKRLERDLADNSIIWAPALEGALLVSVRGGDYELSVGQDLSIGYAYHTKHEVELYLTESFTFRVLEPRAAVRIDRA